MNKYLALTKTFINSVAMSKPQDKKRKVMMGILAFFGIFCVMIPICIVIGGVMYILTNVLMQYGTQEAGAQLMMHIISLCTIFFGINVVFNEFYFSNDIEYLMPWPLKAREIVGAKFTATYMLENIMQMMLVISCLIGYFMAAGTDALRVIMAVIGMITVPILPLAYCGILSIIVMGMTRFVKSKEMVQRVSLGMLILMLFIFVGSIGLLQDMNVEHIVEELSSGKQGFVNLMNVVFPTIPLMVKAFASGDVWAMLLYIIISAVVVLVMLGLAELLYFKGINGITSSKENGNGKKLEVLLKKSKKRNVFWSYFLKEVRMLVRTPVFFTNCILVNFMWPIFAYAIYKLQSNTLSISRLRELYQLGDIKVHMVLLLGSVGVSVIMAAIGSLGSNAISREGKHFSFMKYIPVSYGVQWGVKTLVAIVFPLVGILVYFIPTCVLLRLPILDSLLYVLIITFSVTFVAMLGIYIDSIQPKLIWDDELSALRENYNTFFAMAISVGYALLVCVGGYCIYCFTPMSLWGIMILLCVILLMSNVVMLGATIKVYEKNIQEQEET